MRRVQTFFALCLFFLISVFIGKTDVSAANYTMQANGVWVDGNLTEKGGSDYYKITVPESGTLTITYQGLGIGYSWFYLYDEDISERYKQSSIVNNTSETNPKTQDMAVDLQKGTYQVRVAGHAGDCTGTYRLKASFEPIGSNEVEPNDTYQTAMPLAGTQKITGFLPVNEEQDFYRFVLTKDTMVDIKYINHYNGGLPKPGVDGIIAVYDENYQEVDRTRPINDQYEFCETLSAGTYYIKVTKFYGGSGMYILQYSDTHTHTWDDGRVTEAASCSKEGSKLYTCTVCKETRTETIAKTAHNFSTTTTPATCSKAGERKETCTVCGETRVTAIPMLTHKYTTTVTKATTKKNGAITQKCSVCGHVGTRTEIPYAKTMKLSASSYAYNGKARKPSVTILDAKGKKISSSNYTVTYAKGRKNIGTYKVTVKLKGNYSGTLSKTFKIVPKSTRITSLRGTKRGFTIKWKKQLSKFATGYQIQYSTNRSFRGGKILKVKGSTKVSAKKTRLKAAKKYYVRIRTYKTVSGKTYYSSWSAIKSVKTKR